MCHLCGLPHHDSFPLSNAARAERAALRRRAERVRPTGAAPVSLIIWETEAP